MPLARALVGYTGLSDFNSPLAHLRFMLDYAFKLSRAHGPANQESYPWQWLLNDVQMTYMRIDEQVKAVTVGAKPLHILRLRTISMRWR